MPQDPQNLQRVLASADDLVAEAVRAASGDSEAAAEALAFALGRVVERAGLRLEDVIATLREAHAASYATSRAGEDLAGRDDEESG